MKSFSFSAPSPESFSGTAIADSSDLKQAEHDLRALPDRFKEVVSTLSASQLDTKTEKGIWTVRQVVHHTADSHMHALIRFKFALSNDSPEIMPYPEHLWAEYPDTKSSSVENSLLILKGVHERWADTLSSLSMEQLERKYYHPGDKEFVKIGKQVPMYIWHGNYHLGFIMRTL